MEVYSDFFMYGTGIYEKTNLALDGEGNSGFHSVKIIGWGEENSKPYWVRVEPRQSNMYICMYIRTLMETFSFASTLGANLGAKLVFSESYAVGTSARLRTS